MTDARLIEKIDALLPQTQCGLCDTPGCTPYATAIVQGDAPIDKCLPGGVSTLKQIANLTGVDPTPLIPGMQHKQKPPMRARIDESQCIGCTKCIQACPVDAIVGRAKRMHTILETECTGCELCVPPCPVDCIDLEIIPHKTYDPALARERFEARTHRLAERNNARKAAYEARKLTKTDPLQAKRDYIQAAIARANAKRDKP